MLSKLIKSNFKNDLSHMITFFLIMVLAVFMLHTGLAILFGYSTLHAEKKEEYNFADMVVYSMLTPEDKEEIEEIISQSDFVESYEKYYPINQSFEKTKAGSDEESQDMYDTDTASLMVLPYGEWGELEAPHFVELSDEEYENPIYISIYYNTNLLKAKLGDSIDMKVGGKYYTFQVAGIFESLLSSETGITYVSPSLYEEWKTEKYNQVEEAVSEQIDEEDEASEETVARTLTLFYLNTGDGISLDDAIGQLTKEFSDKELRATCWNSDNVINDFTFMQNMIAAMLAAFALIITIISMIIIYFRVANSIEQNITNIGALKSLGYTSRQIRLSMVIEFAATTLVAVLAGIGISYLIIPGFEQMIRSFSGVVWDHPFDAASFVITIVLIVGTVVAVSFISTRRIGRLDPVVALRFGLDSHSFKKNRAPIEKTAGPLTWIMALKSVLVSTKQNIILFVVTLSIGIVSTFSVFLAYNCVYDPSYLLRMLNLVAADVDLNFKDGDIPLGEIAALPEVESVYWMDLAEMTTEGRTIYTYITDDWNSISEVNLYEGRNPVYDNEVAIGGNLSETLGIEIGDEINITYRQEERTYLVTGIEQSSNNYGNIVSMTAEGVEHLKYEPDKSGVGVFVKGHTLANTRKLIEDVQDMYGDKLLRYGNAIEIINNGDQPVVAVAGGMVAAMVLVSLAVIILSLNLLVKTMIIKKQKEIGIKKALGFSSAQLRLELVLSMLPQITIGAAVGAVIGCLVSNNILASLLSSMGIMRSNMEVFPWMGVSAVVAIVVVSFVIIWMLSRKIKHISAYSLITE